MLLLIIPSIILIIGIFLVTRTYIEFAGAIITAIGATTLVIIGVCTILICVAAPAEKIAARQEYETIIYEIDNKFYSNDNEVGKADLVNRIRDFNITREQEIFYHNSPWTNWQNPIIYGAYPEIAVPAYLTPGGTN